MSSMNVTYAAALAAKTFLAALSLTTVATTSIYAEQEPADDGDNQPKKRALPSVTFFGTNAQEFPIGTGNYNLDLHCLIEASFDGTDDSGFGDIIGEIFGAVHTSTIAADLSAIDGFTCFGVAESNQISGFDAARRMRKQELVISIHCCCADIS